MWASGVVGWERGVLGSGGEMAPGLETTAGAWAGKEVAVRRAAWQVK